MNSFRGPENRCEKDGDCRGGAVCDKGLLRCVTRESVASREIYAKIFPEGDAAQVFPVTFSEDNTASIKLEARESVFFSVKTPYDETLLTLNARIIIVDNQAIPGQSPHVVTAEVTQSDDDIVKVALWPGERRYSVHIVPKDISESTPPPAYWDNLGVVSGGLEGEAARLKDEDGDKLSLLVVPAPAPEPIIGTLYRGQQPLSGFRVDAVDPETGRVISTPSVTGCLEEAGDEICGEFEIKINREGNGTDGDGSGYILRIRRENDPSYPQYMVPSDALSFEDDRISLQLDLLPNPVRYKALLEGSVVLSNGVVVNDRIEGGLLLFSSREQVDSIDKSMMVTARSDQSGHVRGGVDELGVYLYPGDYEVCIVPPPTAFGASISYGYYYDNRRIEALSISHNSDNLIELPHRRRVLGNVAFDGISVPGARITAYPIEHPCLDYADIQYSELYVDGDLSLWLDAGKYLLVTEVPIGTGMAYGITETTVEMHERTSEEILPPDTRLPDLAPSMPVVVKLELESATFDLSRVEVEWYEVVEGVSILIGRSKSNAKGSVIGLLPPSVEKTESER